MPILPKMLIKTTEKTLLSKEASIEKPYKFVYVCMSHDQPPLGLTSATSVPLFGILLCNIKSQRLGAS